MTRLLVTFDVEELDGGGGSGAAAGATTWSARGLDVVLPALERASIRATFFSTATFAREQRRSVRTVAAAGHEVASHGWDHRDDYSRLPAETAIPRLADARRAVEDASGRAVGGIRTPRLAVCPARHLVEAGFRYDASPHPTWVKGGRRGLATPRVPWVEEGIVRMPISVVPFVRLPVAWYVFRLAGPGPLLAMARLAGAGAPYVHLYFHPWEAVDVSSLLGPSPLGWRTGPGWARRLEALLSRLAVRLEATTVGEAATDLTKNWAPGRSRPEP